MYKTTRAFSLVELLVTTAIMTAILSVVLWNYGDFNDQLALSAAAQELALDIREAQTYGINVKESSFTPNDFTRSYGLHIISGVSNYRIFIDTDNMQDYDHGTGGCFGSPTECIRRVDLRNGIYVSNVCDATSCPPAVGVTRINLIFIRPSPDAKIYFTNAVNVPNISGPHSMARVQLTSPKGKIKYVIIESTGQVSIQ